MSPVVGRRVAKGLTGHVASAAGSRYLLRYHHFAARVNVASGNRASRRPASRAGILSGRHASGGSGCWDSRRRSALQRRPGEAAFERRVSSAACSFLRSAHSGGFRARRMQVHHLLRDLCSSGPRALRFTGLPQTAHVGLAMSDSTSSPQEAATEHIIPPLAVEGKPRVVGACGERSRSWAASSLMTSSRRPDAAGLRRRRGDCDPVADAGHARCAAPRSSRGLGRRARGRRHLESLRRDRAPDSRRAHRLDAATRVDPEHGSLARSRSSIASRSSRCRRAGRSAACSTSSRRSAGRTCAGWRSCG